MLAVFVLAFIVFLEKIFNVYAPKYAKRAKELGQGGGYTRIIKLGTRRGDASEMAIVELV